MLLISDLHLTDKKMDSYRWEIFDFVLSHYKKHDDKNLIILGDLTDSKDHHSAKLVNKIVEIMRMLVEHGMEIFILKGNHDYIDPDIPFFEFLSQIQYVNYIKDPHVWLIQGEECLFLPHTRQPLADWAVNRIVEKYKKKASIVFMHQSVIGSVTSNGYLMERGLSPKYFGRFKGIVFAGDIHVPQEIGPVTYVGSPYSVRFNDHFKGRAVHIKPEGYVEFINTQIPGRRTIDMHKIEDLRDSDANSGDQVKVRVHVKHSTTIGDVLKSDIERECKDLGFELCSLHLVKDKKFPLRKKRRNIQKTKRPSEIITSFSKQRGIDKTKQTIGRELVED